MKITIPFKTPSINHLYGSRGFRKFLTKEAKELREEIINICNKAIWDPLENTKLKVIVEIHEDWNTKKGEVKRKDISNREKFLIDSIFQGLNLDDKFIFEHTMIKVQDVREFALITIERRENL